MQTLYIGNSEDVSLTNTVSANGTALNSGTAYFSLSYSSNGTSIVSNVSMPYVAASNGNYSGIMTATVTGALLIGTTYNLDISFSQSSYVALFREICVAQYRG